MRIPAFPDDEILRRIEWLGPLMPRPRPGSHPLMHVHLAPVYATEWPGAAAAPSAEEAQATDHRTVLLPAAFLPFAKVGSFWRGRTLLQDRAFSQPLHFTIQPKHAQLWSMTDLSNPELVVQLTPLLTRHLGPAATPQAMRSWMLLTTSARPDYEYLCIPSVLIFQACLATSKVAIQRLLFGKLNKMAGRLSRFMPGEPGTFIVELEAALKDEEAPAVANLVADERAKYAYRLMHQELVTRNAAILANQISPAELPWRLDWLFTKPAELTVWGRSIPLREDAPDGPQVFLVEQIERVKPTYAFSKLVILRDHEKTRQRDESSTTDIRVKSQQDVELPEPLTLSPQGYAEAQFKKKVVPTFGAVDNSELETAWTAVEVQRYRNYLLTQAPPPEKPSGEGTLNDAARNNAGHVHMEIKAKVPPFVPLSLQHFFDALTELRAQKVRVQTIAVAPGAFWDKASRETINVFPDKIDSLRSWHLIKTATTEQQRAYVVAQIEHGGRWHYVIDIQRKDTHVLALGYLRSLRDEPIEAEKLKDFMLNVASHHGWSDAHQFEPAKFAKINHRPQAGAKACARAILARLTRP